MSRTTLILDSSQISSWSECKELWRLTNIESLDAKKENRRDEALTAGTLFHKWLEIYYKSLALGEDAKATVAKVVNFDCDAADSDPQDQGHFPLDSEMRQQLKQRFIDYLMRYSGNDYTTICKTEPTIICDKSGQLQDSRRLVPLIEQGFSYRLFESSTYLFVLEGRIDWIATQQGTNLWVDHKLQFRERELYRKSIQFRNYCLATGLNIGIINYVRMHKTIGPKTFVRQPISFGVLEIDNWRQELIEIFKEIADFQSIPRPRQRWLNRKSCEGKFGYPCKFVSVCEEYNSDTREAVKQRDFEPKKEWKPW